MKSTEYTLIVPALPPSGNHRNGRRKDGREYRKLGTQRYHLLVQGEWARQHGGLIDAPHYAIDLLFQWDKSRTREADGGNWEKVALDALEGAGVITNDKYVTDLSWHKQQGPCDQTVFTIRPLY